MTILIDHHQRQDTFSRLNTPISSLKALLIRVNNVADGLLESMQRPTRPAWLQYLQELDIRGVEFNNRHDFSDVDGPLPNLVILKCPVLVAIRLIKYTPQLRELTIAKSDFAKPITDPWNFNHLIILATAYDINKRPPLTRIALEFYPRWNTFLEMLTMYCQPRKNKQDVILRSVELPAVPHLSILRPLMSALHGERVAAKSDLSILLSSWEGCNYCRRSGWKCRYLKKDYCDRHSPYDLITITSDTSVG
jgi:hypothetical protein